MSSILTPLAVTSAGTKAVANVAFDAYQTTDRNISKKLYLDGSTYVNTLSAAVLAGTETVQNTNFPLAGDAYETIYFFDDTEADRPLVGTQRDYFRITAPAINAGRVYSFAQDLTNENHFVLVVKSASTSVAGKVKIRSGVGQEAVCAFTTSATANTWERKIFDFKVNGSTGVTFTGNPDFSAITEVEITLDAASNADFAMFYFVNQYEQIIGHLLKARTNCVSEYAIERTVDQADLMCRQQVERSTMTNKAININVGTKKQDLFVEGLGMGDIIQKKTAYIIETVNSANVGGKVITTNTITLNVGSDANIIDTVYIGNQRIVRYDSATNLPTNGYHYNTSTGVWTFAGQNGKIPTITINNAVSLNAIEDKELYEGYVGVLRIEIFVNDTKIKQYQAKKAKIMYNDTAINEDFDQENYTYKVYRDDDGVYMTKFLQS